MDSNHFSKLIKHTLEETAFPYLIETWFRIAANKFKGGVFSSFHKGNNNTFVNLWKGCFWKLRSYPIDQLRNLLSTRFRPFEGILRAISSRKMRGERRKEGGSFEIETGSDQIGSIARDGADSSREKEEREREEKGISRKIEGQKEKKDGDIDAIYRISRMKLVFTRDPVLHASKVYRACIYALMEFPECDAWHD